MVQAPLHSQAEEPDITFIALVLSALVELQRAHLTPQVSAQQLPDTLGPGWRSHLWRYLASTPAPEDVALFELRERLGLTPLEVMSVALALCIERDTLATRIVAQLQAQSDEAGPTLGLLQVLFGFDAEGRTVSIDGLLQGAAVDSGLLEVRNPGAPLVERSIRVPTHAVLALAGITASREGFSLDAHEDEVPLPPSILKEAERHAEGLAQEPNRALVIRSGASREGRAVARAVALGLGREPLFITGDNIVGLAPWLYLRNWLPVFERQLGPADRFQVPNIARYEGPMLITLGPDGSVDVSRGSAFTWRVTIPAAVERQALWLQALGDETLAAELAPLHRHGSSRIAELGRLARQRAQMDRRSVERADIIEVASMTSATGLDALAEPIVAKVDRSAIVLPRNTKKELELLAQRCRLREALSTGLGPAAKTRYRPGVRALFTGASGTGKTLAASWLATELGAPLYRVDVASVVSKYIGETEKNLAQLFARAEHAEVMLLFDEADSLFGKRTEVRQANDRFANTQTNYLLQRMESYEGIVVLTSNNRSRFDSAFTRRLDFVIDFPEPAAEERRDLWLAHLGESHGLSHDQVNQLAVIIDLAGGHIRNVVLCAAVLARHDERAISWDDVVTGLGVEYRKLGKQLPSSIRGAAPRKERLRP